VSIVRETCRCGASVEFDDRAFVGASDTEKRLSAFRRDHRCATETTGAVQPEAIEDASGAAPVPDPDPTCACGHPRSAHNTVGCVTRTLDPAQSFFCPCMVSWYEVAP
jgi:hypothetical protein